MHRLDDSDAVYEWLDRFYRMGVRDGLERFARLRAAGPVVLGRGADFGEVVVPDLWDLRDRPTAMTLTFDASATVLRTPETFAHTVYAKETGAENPIFRDGEAHRRFRQMVLSAFTPKAVKQWEDTARYVANELVDAFVTTGRADLVRDFDRKLPALVFGDFMGVPPADVDRLSAWAVRQFHPFDDDGRLAVAHLATYFDELIRERRRSSPRKLGERRDLVSLLIRVELDGRALTDTEINTTLHILLIGGVDTPYKGLNSTLYYLLREPSALAAVRENRGHVLPAIEEALRLGSPNVFGAAREVAVATELAGVRLAAGTIVILNLAMANRDPAEWPRADEFDLARASRGSLAWGTGPHVCLGMHLARLMMATGVNVLLDRCRDLRLDPEAPIPALSGVGSLSPKELRVVFEGRPE